MTSLLIQAATYNAYLSANRGTLDLTSWLAPTLADPGPSRQSSVAFSHSQPTPYATPSLPKRNRREASGSSSHSAPSSPLLEIPPSLTGTDRPPDIVAVGFQEALPLSSSLIGLTSNVLDAHDLNIKAAIEKAATKRSARRHSPQASTASAASPKTPLRSAPATETYTLLSKYVIGGTALLVYSLDRTTTPFVRDVRVTSAGTGIGGLMGNKGAVAVRVGFDFTSTRLPAANQAVMSSIRAGLDKNGTWGGQGQVTFVCAHLAAHQHQVERRNRDWRNLVERLVFTADSQSPHFSPRRGGHDEEGKRRSGVDEFQIYDTSALVVMGDLNYRIDLKEPKTLRTKDIGLKMHYEKEELLEHDQLRLQWEQGRTMHGLSEGIINFPPTYKFKVGTVDEYKDFNKRVPGWTDRILFASWADLQPANSIPTVKQPSGSTSSPLPSPQPSELAPAGGTQVILYRSVPSFTLSDHKPVTALLMLPPMPEGAKLQTRAPFPIDKAWRRKRLVGWAMDRAVGTIWFSLVLAGAGDTKRGVVVWALLLLGWYYLRG